MPSSSSPTPALPGHPPSLFCRLPLAAENLGRKKRSDLWKRGCVYACACVCLRVSISQPERRGANELYLSVPALKESHPSGKQDLQVESVLISSTKAKNKNYLSVFAGALGLIRGLAGAGRGSGNRRGRGFFHRVCWHFGYSRSFTQNQGGGERKRRTEGHWARDSTVYPTGACFLRIKMGRLPQEKGGRQGCVCKKKKAIAPRQVAERLPAGSGFRSSRCFGCGAPLPPGFI